MSETMNESDMTSFGIIASAGDARSFAFQALEAAKSGDFDEAKRLIEEMKKHRRKRIKHKQIYCFKK